MPIEQSEMEIRDCEIGRNKQSNKRTNTKIVERRKALAGFRSVAQLH
jgi:hypothetical protein